MKLPKKYTHYLSRRDAPEQITPCISLADAKQSAETAWEIARYTNKPEYDICVRTGAVVAHMIDGTAV